ncbi:hypothetical protein PUNSTDRAFT_78193, partial [Punctularia strigosozonata HHB-11173 SS5]
MIVKIVNSLTAKHEIGAPFVAQYLLGFPDHYTNRTFRVFYWKGYVALLSDTVLRSDDELQAQVDGDDAVMIDNIKGSVVELAYSHDWIHRPSRYRNWCLIDYMKKTYKKK